MTNLLVKRGKSDFCGSSHSRAEEICMPLNRLPPAEVACKLERATGRATRSQSAMVHSTGALNITPAQYDTSTKQAPSRYATSKSISVGRPSSSASSTSHFLIT